MFVFLENFAYVLNEWSLGLNAKDLSQAAITCSQLSKETLEQGVNYVQS